MMVVVICGVTGVMAMVVEVSIVAQVVAVVLAMVVEVLGSSRAYCGGSGDGGGVPTIAPSDLPYRWLYVRTFSPR